MPANTIKDAENSIKEVPTEVIGIINLGKYTFDIIFS
jgi:hypothetical protein